ncbi:DUF4127 family protein [Photobacterium sp. DA100]|uniref:DUF4127 family protein n=1 Tax=Photobacterium sp. DA100 TaxID=3027472 RepID=UPI002478C39B|nr:DUF4127 family protein [Photobacterium sp. DA100]WEM43199.1 DUF4127 family protein [Photobacterium sp. DA100]
MKTLFIPLDERPCNKLYPEYIAKTADIELVNVPDSLLSNKKRPANTEQLWQYVFANMAGVDAVILSVEMMMYGGLIPSRLHALEDSDKQTFVANLRRLRAQNPETKIYAYNCIMRCPSYSSSDEEPEYYDDFGAEIFKRKYLQDKQQRHGLEGDELVQLGELADSVPQFVLADFEGRRAFNSSVNMAVAELVKDKVINFLVIPQDDSSPYGYTALDQKKVLGYIEQQDLSFDIAIYPGADEVGVTLLGRAFNEYHGKVPKVFPFYASTLGPQTIPLYEDRPMNESVKSHIRAVGGRWCDNSQEADLVLAINSPGKIMQEAAQQSEKDLTYSSGRNLQDFALRIKDYLDAGKKVVLADSAFANGGDLELIRFLNKLGVLGQLASYKGWNTNCNTLGSTLGAGMIADIGQPAVVENVVYHVLEDVCYQSVVRSELLQRYFSDAAFGHTSYQPEQELQAMAYTAQRLLELYRALTADSLPQDVALETYAPWHRTFELGIRLKVGG